MKIAVYTIAKNEEQFIQRWADSCKEADYRLIVDTGSTDNTLATAELAGCHTASIVVDPWRFDDARNASLMLIPPDIDYCIALDADEVLVPGWRQEIEKVAAGTTRPRYKYVWSWNSDGSEGLTYSGDKIHSRHGYRWTHPVHEVLTPTITEVQNWTNLQIHHYPDTSKSRSQYLPLLELAVQERPDDDRNRFYLGRELMFNGRNEEAKVHFVRHLELSSWAPERATCMRYLGRVTGEREKWTLRACAEAPYRREPWVDLAMFYYEQRNWPACYSASVNALRLVEKPLEYLCEAEAWGALPHDLAAVSAWNLGLKLVALDHGSDALALSPDDSRLRENVASMYRGLRCSDVIAVIPTKSNFVGLEQVVDDLIGDHAVIKIVVVADGSSAFAAVNKMFAGFADDRIEVFEAGLDDDTSGIHYMWNLCFHLQMKFPDAHCLFLNDDVEIKNLSASTLAGFLDVKKEFGLICPNYDGRNSQNVVVETDTTCRGRYDGTGGMAGFCMMLSSDLCHDWRFDERMKWWYGDDDILHWTLSKGRKAGICTVTNIQGNSSWTVNSDPPKNFAALVENDRKIFELKWPGR